VPPSQHHSLRPLAVIEVDNFVEKEGPASGPCESRRDQLSSVGQEGFAVDAAEEAEPAHVRQVVTTHLEVIFKNLPVWLFPLTDKLLFCLLWSQITSASSGSDATGLDLSCHRLGAIPEVGLGGLGAIWSEGLWELEGRFL